MVYFTCYQTNIQEWAKKWLIQWNCNNLFWLIKIISYFRNTYGGISIWVINNKYRSICQPSTSITHRSLGLNALLHLSMIFCGILSNSSIMASLKQSRSVVLRSLYAFCSKSPKPQNLLGWNLDYLVASDGALVIWGSFFLSFNISSFAVWALAQSCMNKLCFARLFISEIIFFKSALQ